MVSPWCYQLMIVWVGAFLTFSATLLQGTIPLQFLKKHVSETLSLLVKQSFSCLVEFLIVEEKRVVEWRKMEVVKSFLFLLFSGNAEKLDPICEGHFFEYLSMLGHMHFS